MDTHYIMAERTAIKTTFCLVLANNQTIKAKNPLYIDKNQEKSSNFAARTII